MRFRLPAPKFGRWHVYQKVTLHEVPHTSEHFEHMFAVPDVRADLWLDSQFFEQFAPKSRVVVFALFKAATRSGPDSTVIELRSQQQEAAVWCNDYGSRS